MGDLGQTQYFSVVFTFGASKTPPTVSTEGGALDASAGAMAPQ